MTTSRKTVLVTGANGYIGNGVAKAFSRAGWRTYGLLRKPEDAAGLARDEIFPLIGSPLDLRFLDACGEVTFDAVVSNTEDARDPAAHFAGVRAMLEEVAGRSRRAGTRSLVMFTSGCKDYGPMTLKHGDAGLAAHTEGSPTDPPEHLVPRKDFGLFLLQQSGLLYDATVLRPTIVYGHGSSYYGSLFALAAGSHRRLTLFADPNAIMHSLHVDDCGDAYVALARHPDREQVAGEAFNISNRRYETAQEVGEALAACYGLELAFAPPEDAPSHPAQALARFWQWVASDKIRALTGWSERRATFTDGIGQYRLAYEAFRQALR